ncbi:MAG: acyl--CoA ligase [Clostridia bacterium]|nr:acyl--CoA ligase [Clostridia bacterium]
MKYVIFNYLQQFAMQEPHRMYMFDESKQYTASDTFFAVVDAANKLYKMGLNNGNMVVLHAKRCVETVVVYYALQALGVVAVLADPHNVESVRNDTKQLGIAEKAEILYQANGSWKVDFSTHVCEFFVETSSCVAQFPLATNHLAPSTVVLTSGSTGHCKGVVLCQKNILNHVLNYSVAGNYLKEDIALELLPLHHVFGLTVPIQALIRRHKLLFPREVSVQNVAEMVEKYCVNRVDSVPTFALALAHYKQQNNLSLNSIEKGIIGGAPVSAKQFAFIEKTLHIKLMPVYGMSECIGISGVDLFAPQHFRQHSVGKFLPTCQGKIVDTNGVALPQNQQGEICVKCPSVMLGYFGDEDATQLAMDSDGFLHTGDLGYIDQENYLYVTGRIKDIVIRNGHNISSIKVENVVKAMDDVFDACVVGIADDVIGEALCVAVVLKNKMTLQKFQDKLSQLLSKLEMPSKILLMEQLPLTSTRKPDKQAIKQLFAGK